MDRLQHYMFWSCLMFPCSVPEAGLAPAQAALRPHPGQAHQQPGQGGRPHRGQGHQAGHQGLRGHLLYLHYSEYFLDTNLCVIPSQEEPVIVVRIPTTAANAKMVLKEDYNSEWDDLAPETFRDKVAKLLGTIVVILCVDIEHHHYSRIFSS